MRMCRPGLIALVFFSLPILVAGQESASVPAQAIAILQSSLKALVGSAVVTDVTISAAANLTTGSDDETGTATLTAMSAGESKLSLEFPSGSRIEIRTPAGTPPSGAPAGATIPAGIWSGADGAPHSVASQNLMTDATWFFPAFTIGKLISSTNYVTSYLGEEMHNGQQVLHVSASQQFFLNVASQAPVPAPPLFQHLSQMDLYLDPATLLPLELDFNVHPDNNAFSDIPVQISFSDYRAVNGIQVPFHVQRYWNNSLALDLQFNDVVFDSGLTAASFAVN